MNKSANKATPLPCPKCERPVSIWPQEGGRGTGELTSYMVECKCGLVLKHLGLLDGTKRSAAAEWNRYAKEYKP